MRLSAASVSALEGVALVSVSLTVVVAAGSGDVTPFGISPFTVMPFGISPARTEQASARVNAVTLRVLRIAIFPFSC